MWVWIAIFLAAPRFAPAAVVEILPEPVSIAPPLSEVPALLPAPVESAPPVLDMAAPALDLGEIREAGRAAVEAARALKENKAPAEESAELGRPFDGGKSRAAGTGSVEAGQPAALSGISAAAVFTPAGSVQVRRQTLIPTTRFIEWPRSQEAKSPGPSGSQLFLNKTPLKKMQESSDGARNFLRFSLGQARVGNIPLAFASKADMAAWSDGSTMWFVNHRGEELARFFRGQSAPGAIARLALSPLGDRAAYAVQFQRGDPVVEMVDLKSGKTRRLMPGGRIHNLAVDGERVFILHGAGRLLVWDLSMGRSADYALPGKYLEAGKAGQDPPVVSSPDGTRVLVGDHAGGLRILTLSSNYPEITELDNLSSPITAAAWSPDGTKIGGAAADGYFGVWNLGKKELLRFNAVTAPAAPSVVWDEAGNSLVWANTRTVVRAEFAQGTASLAEVKLPQDIVFTQLRDGGAAALFWTYTRWGSDVSLMLLVPPRPAGAAPARANMSERERVALLGTVRQEIMDRMEVFESEKLVRKLYMYCTNSLEIFQIAGRKWLGLLAALGDDEAAEAEASLRILDAQPKTKPIKRPKVQ